MFPLAMFNSPTEWAIVLGVIILLFGGKKIPELMRGVGQGVGQLQKGLEEGKQAMNQSFDDIRKTDEAKPLPDTTQTNVH